MNSNFEFSIFQQAGEIFLRKLTAELCSLGIPADSLASDHLCFRVGTAKEYDFYKMALRAHGTLLTEALVNGRAISTFALDSPFRTGAHEVRLLELPAPKNGAPYETGFEHAEFVISECFSSFAAKYPSLDFAESGNRTLNPELCLRLGGGGRQAKFHHLPLDRVIELEEAQVKDIIFDLDGTLIKARENIYEINRIVFSRALEREVSLAESIANYHPEFSKLFEAFALRCPVKQRESIAAWGAVSEQFSYEIFVGCIETLEALRRHGYRLHLWTARDECSARKILRGHGIEEMFVTLSFADSQNSKPSAHSLRFEWQSTGRNQVIVVGDSPSDMRGAQNISAIRAAALWDPHVKRAALVESGAELFFYGMQELKEWLIGGSA